ncbi:hypothetical protein TWF506_004062 [Arthrobotrys conoides]|uniref:C2H2-type domain-containing protein n=1 Tax=Arthrobotrys conoides TaxID=74498 RepID=A0AAN8RIL2_9PEZI
MAFAPPSFILLHDTANELGFTHESPRTHTRRGSITNQGLRQANVVDVQNSPQNQSSSHFSFPSRSLPEAGLTQEMGWLNSAAFLPPMHPEITTDNTILGSYTQYPNDEFWRRGFATDSTSRVDSQPAVESHENGYAGPSGPDSSRPAQDTNSHWLHAQDQSSAPLTDLPILGPLSAQDPNPPGYQHPNPNISSENSPDNYKPSLANRRQGSSERACRDISKSDCNRTFTNERTFGEHLLKYHNIKAFCCPNMGCTYGSSRKDNVNSHQKKCKFRDGARPSHSISTSTTPQFVRRSRLNSSHSQSETFMHPMPHNIRLPSQNTEVNMSYPPAPGVTRTPAFLPSRIGEESSISNASFISMGNGNSIDIAITQATSSNFQPEPHVGARPISRDALELENARLREELNILTRKLEKMEAQRKSLVTSLHLLTGIGT